jgi:hypothetical protein
MTDSITVFVNERPVVIERGAGAGQAVRRADAALGAAVREGRAHLTDGRGIRLDADAPLHAGAILRAVVSARRTDAAPGAQAGADADHP